VFDGLLTLRCVHRRQQAETVAACPSLAKRKAIVFSLNKTPVSAATFPTRVESLTGITFNSKLRFEPHISYIAHLAAIDAFMA